VLTLMGEIGVKPDVITFSTIMNAWSSAGFMDKCQEIFDDMVRAGIKPDPHAYSILAKGYVRAQEPEKAEELLDSMIASGFHPNVVIFTTVISGWCSSRRMEPAIKVFNQMCELGIEPNLKTFETLIWGFLEAKLPWKAEEILQIMEEFEVKPEKSTFSLVAEAWRLSGLSREANRIMGNFQNATKSSPKRDTEEKGSAMESLERIYERQQSNSFSTLLQIPGEAAASAKRSRMVSWFVAKAAYAIPQTCKFGTRLPTIWQKQQPQGFSGLGQPCTAVFLN
ncbi:hypothetical protein CRG98_013614, partial [Punica granatum]